MIPAYAHYGTNSNCSFFDNIHPALYFGDGDRANYYDFSKENDVAFHEYTHAVSWQIGLGYDGGIISSPPIPWHEDAGLSEGYSDYFAASFTGDSRFKRWAKANNPPERNLSNDPNTYNYAWYSAKFDQYGKTFEPHAGARVWGGCLWDIRNQIGSGNADTVAMGGLILVHGDATMVQARGGLVTKDLKHYGGMHRYVIEHACFLRGIGSSDGFQVNRFYAHKYSKFLYKLYCSRPKHLPGTRCPLSRGRHKCNVCLCVQRPGRRWR